MFYKTLILTLVFVFTGLISCFSQKTQARVSKPELRLENGQLIINYDITASNKDDIFRVWVEITDANNVKINALALSGDIGDEISGGRGKKISWNFTEDNIDSETEIFLQVYAEPQKIIEEEPKEIAENKPKEVNNSKTEVTTENKTGEVADNKPKEKAENIPEEIIENEPENSSGSADEEMHSLKKYSTGKSLYKSVLFPGLGFTGMDQSGFHLAKGVAGYGLIASSLVFNRLAVNNRANYLAEQTDEVKRDNYYDTYTRQDVLSKVFAYSAIGIWTTEIVWLLIDINARNRISDNRNMRISPGYDPVSGAPTFYLSYQF